MLRKTFQNIYVPSSTNRHCLKRYDDAMAMGVSNFLRCVENIFRICYVGRRLVFIFFRFVEHSSHSIEFHKKKNLLLAILSKYSHNEKNIVFFFHSIFFFHIQKLHFDQMFKIQIYIYNNGMHSLSFGLSDILRPCDTYY